MALADGCLDLAREDRDRVGTMLLGSWAFGLYVGHFAAYSATYGPLSTLIGLMMWFYLTAYVVLFGAEVNAALDKEWMREKSGGGRSNATAPTGPARATMKG